PELRMAVLAALALHPEADQRELTDRVVWLSQKLRCHERTARRRMDDGFHVLVDRLTAGAGKRRQATPPDAYSIKEFRALLRLDTPLPELTEYRTIPANLDGVGEVEVLLSLPRAEGDASAVHDITAEPLYGCRIRKQSRLSAVDFQFTVEL